MRSEEPLVNLVLGLDLVQPREDVRVRANHLLHLPLHLRELRERRGLCRGRLACRRAGGGR